MFEGLRYYIPALLTTGGLLVVGGTFLAILWLLVFSQRLRSQRENIPKGLLTLTAAVLLPLVVIAVLKLIFAVITFPDWLIFIGWWLSLIGSFAMLLVTRRQLRGENGLIPDIAAGGTFVLLCLMGIGILLQIAGFFMS